MYMSFDGLKPVNNKHHKSNKNSDVTYQSILIAMSSPHGRDKSMDRAWGHCNIIYLSSSGVPSSFEKGRKLAPPKTIKNIIDRCILISVENIFYI